MAYVLDFGPAGTKKGLLNMLHGAIHTVVAVALTSGSLYAARYNVNLKDLNLTQPHDIVVGIVYLAWLLFSLFAKQWLLTPTPQASVRVPVSDLTASGTQG